MVYLRPKCANCGKWINYIKPPVHKHEHEFCSKACCSEFHYFKARMSTFQFCILSRLVSAGGESALKDSKTLIILSKRIMPLIEIIGRIDETTVYVAITDKGRYWHSTKRGIEV